MIKFLSQFIRHFLLSVQFFTRIPVTGRLADWVGFSPAMLRDSAAHFPGVGWLVGGLVAAFTMVLLVWLPPADFAPLVAAVWGTAFGVLLTGAFHEDGLADVHQFAGAPCSCAAPNAAEAMAWSLALDMAEAATPYMADGTPLVTNSTV